jgi:hypothetical protein
MKFSTPMSISNWFYLGWNFVNNSGGEERFGISIGRFYVGYYSAGMPGVSGFCAGILDANGCLN